MVRILYTSNNETHELNIETGSKVQVVPGSEYAFPDNVITLHNVVRSIDDLKVQLYNNQTIKLGDFFANTTDTPTLLLLTTTAEEGPHYVTSQELFTITHPDSAVVGSEFVVDVTPKIPKHVDLNLNPHPQHAEQMDWLNADKSEENYILKGEPSNDNLGHSLMMLTGSYEENGTNLFYMQTLPLFITSDYSSSFSFAAHSPEIPETFGKRSTQIQYSMFLAIPIFLALSQSEAYAFTGQFLAAPTVTGTQTQIDIQGIEEDIETSIKAPIIKFKPPNIQEEEADIEGTAFGQRSPLEIIEFGIVSPSFTSVVEGEVIEVIRPEPENPILTDAPFSTFDSFVNSGDVSTAEGAAGALNVVVGFNGVLQEGDFITIGVNFNPGNTEPNDFVMPFSSALAASVVGQPGVELVNTNDVKFSGGPNNATQVSVDFMIAGDNFVEGTETFSITFSIVDASSNVIIPPDVESPVIGGTILDNDIATFDLSVDETTITEEIGLPSTAIFSISLSNPLEAGNEASVIISSGGSATVGVDFTPDVFTSIANAAAATPGVNFNAGTGELTFLSTAPAIFTFAIDAIDDPFFETTIDTVDVTISNAQVLAGTTAIANPSSTVTITDTDGIVTIFFTSNTPTIPEGPATSASFTLGYTGALPTGETLTIGQDLIFSSTIASDFVGPYSQAVLNAVTGQPGVALVGTDVVFTGGPGNVSNINILLPIVDDNLVEGTQTINLGISGSSSTGPFAVGSVTPSADIIDNDVATFSISADQTSIGEEANPPGIPVTIPTTVNFTISLSNGFEFEPFNSGSVFVSTSGDAISGTDFTPDVFTAIQNAVSSIPEITFNSSTGELTFNPGTLNFSFAISSVNDSFFEGTPDALNITLRNPSVDMGTAALGTANATVTISDADPFPGLITLPGGGTVFDQLTVPIDQSLVGDAGPNTLNGFGGNDTLESLGGNDILVYDVLDITRVDGGTGFDTLQVQGSGNNVNLLTTDDEVHKNIEEIDISGSGANSLTLGLHDVFAITDSNNELFITGDADDAVNLQNGINPWQLDPIPVNPGFSTYTADGATLFVDDDVNLTIF